MLSGTIAKGMLNCLVNEGNTHGTSSNGGSNAEFRVVTTLAKLALFTAMPNDQGEGAVEVTLDGYARKPLYGTGISGNMQFGTPAAWDESEGMYAISNTDEIQMHAISEDASGEETVVGFGIYCGTDAKLLAWGKLVNESGEDATVTLKAGSVPIFYTGKFKLMMA